MIKYLQHQQIDRTKWDECIRHTFNGLPYAWSWYLDLVHEGWEALVEGDYERVMPLTGSKKMGVSYMFQPFFAQQLGVFSKSKLNPGIVDEFIQHIPSHVKVIDYNLNSFNKPQRLFQFTHQNNNYLLDLIPDYEKIKSRYSTNIKRNLKKSLKHNISLSKHVKPENLIQLFRQNKGREVKKWNDAQYHILQRIMYTSIYKSRGVIYGVYSEFNELSAAAFFLKNNNRLIFLFSATDESARESQAMSFLIDQVIQEHSAKNMVFDFEGSNDKNLARFYAGFGAKKITYPSLRMNSLKFPIWQFYQMYKRNR